MRVIGIIPARMAATRLPGKPMALIHGMPMIGHCYFRSKLCLGLDEVYVATCDEEIYEYIVGIGGDAVMTSNIHERATERTAEALINIEKLLGISEFDIVVMIQGDEPLINPEMINEAILPLQDGVSQVSNLMSTLKNLDEAQNENFIKVVTDIDGIALYMSREPIPSPKKYRNPIKYNRQLGLIAFTRNALLNFVDLPTTPLEIIESVDMNRLIEHKVPIQMSVTHYEADSVDTLEDLHRVEKKMMKDELYKKYRVF
jgi:3-deoxy-manno-octulosonate cytidylyltransferase (CMP-KDO synthetase)